MTEEKADQIIRCVKECWWRVLLLVAIPTVLITSLFNGWPLSVTLEDSLAAWVQAIGTIIAVVAAFMVGHYQNKNNVRLHYKQQQSIENKENENILAELFASITQLSRIGKTVDAFLYNLSEKTGLLEIKNVKHETSLDRFAGTRTNMHEYSIKEGAFKFNLGKFLDDLEGSFAFNQKTMIFLIEGLKRIDFHSRPYAYIADEAILIFTRYEAIKYSVEDFIKYADSIKAENLDENQILKNMISFLVDLINEHKTITELCNFALENYEHLESRLGASNWLSSSLN